MCLGWVGVFWTGEKMTAIYANQRQTTEHTDKSIKFTHTELGVGKNLLSTAGGGGVGRFPLCYGGFTNRQGHLIISRFVGDGTVDAEKYRKLAAQRALMWEPYLSHYSDTAGQWYRSVVGKCLSILGTPGQSDYFEAVTPEAVKEMWDYTPSPEDSEKAFLQAIQDSFRTHKEVEGNRERVKPKAMFCSKFVSAIWSSTIGNPTNDPNATVRSRDLKIMMPVNPGACSPWTVVQWIVSKSGRKSWKSCVGDLAPGKCSAAWGCTSGAPKPLATCKRGLIGLSLGISGELATAGAIEIGGGPWGGNNGKISDWIGVKIRTLSDF
eukprot:s1874_g26.t1